MNPNCIPALVLALLAVAQSLQANLVSNGDFEGPLGAPNNSGSGGFGPFLTYNAGNPGIPGWTIGGSGVDMWTSFQGTGNNVVDLNALGLGVLTQTFATVAGQSYGVSFDLGGPVATKTMDVTIFGSDGTSALTVEHYAGGFAGTFLPQDFRFVADGNQSTIEFFSTISGFDGLYIDNLDVSAIPIPAAVWLFVSGLLGLVGIARRKHGADRERTVTYLPGQSGHGNAGSRKTSARMTPGNRLARGETTMKNLIAVIALLGAVTSAGASVVVPIELEIIDEINLARIDNGLDALNFDSILFEGSRFHAEDMLAAGALDHSLSDGTSYSENYINFGYPESATTSNLLYFTSLSTISAADIVFNYMISEPHRDIILSQGSWTGYEWNGIGAGYAEGASGKYVSIGFGTAAPAASPVPVPASIWLFGSGLTWFAGVTRRRRLTRPNIRNKWGQTTFSFGFGRSAGFSPGDTSFYHLLDF